MMMLYPTINLVLNKVVCTIYIDAMIGELDADEALMGFVFFAVVFFDEFLKTMVLVLPHHSRFLSVL